MPFSTNTSKLLHRLSAALIAFGTVLVPATALAWGSDGHRLIAQLALQHLSPVARAEVNHLLTLEDGASLASLSVWADEHRSPATAAWHYVNLPKGECHYVESRDCPDGKCVVAAIERQVERLRTAESQEQRLLALKYVVHLVADVHQPLHAGRATDKGGNKFQVHAFGHGTNLHALWDSELIEARFGGPTVLMMSLRSAREPRRTMKPEDWAEESCSIVESEGFYPATRAVGGWYALRWDSTLRQRLSDAAYRLAWVLDAALVRPVPAD
jgi:hypothetical protein